MHIFTNSQPTPGSDTGPDSSAYCKGGIYEVPALWKCGVDVHFNSGMFPNPIDDPSLHRWSRKAKRSGFSVAGVFFYLISFVLF